MYWDFELGVLLGSIIMIKINNWDLGLIRKTGFMNIITDTLRIVINLSLNKFYNIFAPWK